MHAHLKSATADALHVSDRRIVAFKPTLPRKRIMRLYKPHILDDKRIVAGLDLDLAPSSAPPPWSRERRSRPSVREEHVFCSVEILVFPLVATRPPLALFCRKRAPVETVARVERLCPSPGNPGSASPPCGKFRVCAPVVTKVPEKPQIRLRRNRHRPPVGEHGVGIGNGGVPGAGTPVPSGASVRSGFCIP